MKKLSFFLTLLFLLILFLSGNAQPKTGFKAGINAASLSSFEGNHRMGIHAGFFASFNMGKKNKEWQVQPELLYSSEGQRYEFNESQRTIALGYAQIPVMIRYFPSEKFYLECGPQFGFLAHATSSGEDVGKLNVKRSFHNNQFAINAGVGVQISKRISFYGRYQFGLTDVTQGVVVDHSRVILAGLSFQFRKK